MPASDIVIRGAREHNLRDVDLVLPRNQLICLTGVSGSGKSSLAFDTLYAEGQRRYIESLSSFARQFLGQMPKPEVDYISGLSPSISISQKSTGHNPRSTVGTVTEIYDYLRVLFARVGQGHCPKCSKPITAQTREQIIARILQLPSGTKFSILAPLIRAQKGEYKDLFVDLLKQGFVRARVDGEHVSLGDAPKLDRQMRHDIEVVVDRLQLKGDLRARLAEAVEIALKLGAGNLIVATEEGSADVPSAVPQEDADEAGETPAVPKEAPKKQRRARGAARPGDLLFSADYACLDCGLSFEPPSPQLFSFNSPQGMCSHCDGLGELYSFDPELLIPDHSKSFKDGAIETIGTWKELGRWKRHIYQGVADTIERIRELDQGTMLETLWSELDPELRDIWLFGAGEQHITFTWRGGNAPMKYGGTFEGLIPELLSKYRQSKSKMHQRMLEKYMRTAPCPHCRGDRLNPQARAVRVTSQSSPLAPREGNTNSPLKKPKASTNGAQANPLAKGENYLSLTLPEVCDLSIRDAQQFFEALVLDATGQSIATEVLKEIRGRLGFLMNVGLDYLTLSRTAPTLSGGETQRIRLAGQIGSGLVGVLYILDEPSIGLHPRDNDRLLETLHRLRDMGNTVVVVEHDEDTMWAADHIIDFGPGPGVRGGYVVAEGPAGKVVKAAKSVTGKYLSGELKIEIPTERRAPTDKVLRVVGATQNNLKNVTAEIPLGCFVCVTGVSGSGKSSLVNDILVAALHRDLNGGESEPGAYEKIEGLEHLDKLIAIDQSPIGRTPRSNPGTYIKVFDDIRDLFAQMPEAKKRGYKQGRFSFNVAGGRCEACEGNGSNKLEMDFLADVWVTCPVCEGKRFNRETLQVKFKEKSIADVLDMDIQQALQLFENVPHIKHKLQTLHDVGLDYLKIGQPSPTLSGGEAQRVKLAKELVKKSTGKTLYLLDEPTTGLHFADIKQLLDVLRNFVQAGNTVLVVEHNLDVIKTADWILDLGPEGGGAGGEIIGVGTPEQIAANPISHTGRTLAPVLSGAQHAERREHAIDHAKKEKRVVPNGYADRIRVQGARQHNLKGVDATIARDKMTVFCGPSGSGKSSLAMDTIYAEGQRRYVESLSSYARQFVAQMQKPAVDHIEGLSPAIAIEQKNLGHSPRSTVGTVTEIYDYFRILMARLGTPHCPACNVAIGTQTSDQITDKIMAHASGSKLYLMAPLEAEVGQLYTTLWDEVRAAGYARVRVDGTTYSLEKPPDIDRRRKHDVEVVIDRIVVKPEYRSRIADSVEAALSLGRGVMHVAYPQDDVAEPKWRRVAHSQHLACDQCGRSFEPLTPHSFSFNSPLGWCPACEGLGWQTGANPAALLNDPKLTLAQGALALWPNLAAPLAAKMLAALGQETGVPLDVPYEQLNSRHRRVLLYGTGDTWFTVAADKQTPGMKFQFKGLYPALEEASRLSPSLRSKLEQFVGQVDCHTCGGSRLRDDASAARFRGLTIDDITRLPLGDLQRSLKEWKLTARDRKIAGEVIREIENRTAFLNDVGLEYLSLGRGAATLSNGEAQRIRLASQLGSGLCGVLYVLDEPTIGLHPRDNTRLLKAIQKLRDLGNTLLVVEHDREVIENCDHVLDFGPRAGRGGGQIVADAPPDKLGKQKDSVTGPYLTGKKALLIPTNRRMMAISDFAPPIADSKPKTRKKKAPPATQPAEILNQQSASARPWLELINARHNNLRNIDLRIPLGTLTAITGPSGSGKSSLIEDVLYAALAKTLHRASVTPGAFDKLEGLEHINKVIRVDQQPLGNSPTSNPATYTGLFELIRNLFAQLPEAKLRGYNGRRFSFNVPGGRCEKCEGNGQLRIEMHFLPDVWVECDDCKGKRYNAETLAVTYHGHSISDVLDMTCGDAVKLFENIPKIRRVLQTLCDVGLDYLTLGQPAPTLSGGEAQRVKLAAELSRPDTGRTLYLLDEPTTGLHFDDLAKLLDVLQRLVDLGNTVVVIEHNLDIIKSCDWLIDLGPEAGEGGGRIVTQGTPEDIVAHAQKYAAARNGSELLRSHTGEALAPVLAKDPYGERKVHDPHAEIEKRETDLDIEEVGKDAKMPWETNGRRWHTHDRVDRKGAPAKWDGRILERVVDFIQDQGDFADTNWDARSVVEITGHKKSDGWFFHAITGETWLVKLKFRVSKGTFRREQLNEKIKLKTLNQLDELPIYSNEPRLKVKSIRGPWQEVQIAVHTLDEIDTPEFWDFLSQAIGGFQKFSDHVAENREELMPWKKLGQKWHFLRKGFPPGKSPQWDSETLEELCETLSEVAGSDAQFLWNNQQLVHLYLKGSRDPWATIHTKRLPSLDLSLNSPKGSVALGRVRELGFDRDLDGKRSDRDFVVLKFRSVDDLHRGDLIAFLKEHLAIVATKQ